jgi:hypothetical protein
MDNRVGENINGPSLIQAPDWLEPRLAEYYVYFAHHDGHYIRLAVADDLVGPWRTYEAGVLALESSLFRGHVASPDVHVDHAEREIGLYYHGADGPSGGDDPQLTRVALSGNGCAARTGLHSCLRSRLPLSRRARRSARPIADAGEATRAHRGERLCVNVAGTCDPSIHWYGCAAVSAPEAKARLTSRAGVLARQLSSELKPAIPASN